MTSLSSMLSIMFDSLVAMVKIFLVCIVGVILAKYPAKDPILPPVMLKYLSKLSNNVFVPCLIISSLGSAITFQLLQRIGILIVFCGITNSISYGFGYSFGRLLHGADDPMFIALIVAIGSPNAISLPIMVLQTMCEEHYVNKDYNDSPVECYNEATSMIFVYSVGWHLIFWSYGFPKLKTIKSKLSTEIIAIVPSPANPTLPVDKNLYTRMKDMYSIIVEKNWKFINFAKSILFTPAIIGICIGIAVGLIPYLQLLIFEKISVLRPLGSALSTLGEPVVAINCLVMSASLAQVDLFRRKNSDTENNNKSSIACGDENGGNIELHEKIPELAAEVVIKNEHTQDKSDEKKHRKFIKNILSNPRGGQASQYSRIDDDDEESDTDQLSSVEKGMVESVYSKRNNEEQKAMDSEVLEEGEVSHRMDYNIRINVDEDKINIDKLSNFKSADSALELHAKGSRNVVEEWDKNRSLSPVAEDNHDSNLSIDVQKTAEIPSWRSISALILCRMILPPMTVIFLVLPLSIKWGFLSKEERLMRLVISIESCSSSAQVLIIALNQLEIPEVASSLAYMYVFQFISSIFTITLFTSFAVSTIYN